MGKGFPRCEIRAPSPRKTLEASRRMNGLNRHLDLRQLRRPGEGEGEGQGGGKVATGACPVFSKHCCLWSSECSFGFTRNIGNYELTMNLMGLIIRFPGPNLAAGQVESLQQCTFSHWYKRSRAWGAAEKSW
jgi:hypothetical protein